MTITEAIERIDSLTPNGYSREDKIYWLSILDGMVATQVLASYLTEAEKEKFNGYTEDTELTTELLVDDPYSDMYLLWLQSKIEFYNGETDRYNNTMKTFSGIWDDFVKYIIRTKKAKEVKLKYW